MSFGLSARNREEKAMKWVMSRTLKAVDERGAERH